ncbi:acyclic terpene utilization AtuA family protein [Paraburkholderia flava]|uniref:acyclic terpene utilization AtuA family protein n=1 Tax=Paraburkholderia flava TaxID=2547393 RepID=UPI00105E2CD6|nr:acyclic terpene utilization AtuA family protein [Paraburkholderia flava]
MTSTTTRKSPVRIGTGAGYSGDRIEPAVELAEHGALDYLVFECLAERTIALAQQTRRSNPALGYDPLLDARMRAVLPIAVRNRVRIVSNMGAANPLAAARRTAELARELGLPPLKIAAVTGDDVLDAVRQGDYKFEESGERVAEFDGRIVSANAYLGAAPIVDALAAGADIVLTGRVADPSLFIAPLIHEYGWSMDDWNTLGQATVVGHLLECAGQVTGGYFADPGFKDVPDLARLGFPIGEVSADGSLIVTKVPHAGGCVTEATCKEQLLYEVHDCSRYLQPDVVADFTGVRIEQEARDRVRVSGGRGTPRTATLKTSVAYVDGFIGEGQISYAGPGALARARLALDVVRERLRLTGVHASELRFDLIGVDALHGATLAAREAEPYEVRVRVAGRTGTLNEAVRIGNEVETLYTNGPAGGGGATKSAREVIAVQSVLLPRELVHPTFELVEG